jgi:hypothetical protein
MATKDGATHVEDSHNAPHGKSQTDARIVPIEQEATEHVRHVDLSWRSWVVVFVCCFAYAILGLQFGNSSNVDSESCPKSSSSWQPAPSCPSSSVSLASLQLRAGSSRYIPCHLSKAHNLRCEGPSIDAIGLVTPCWPLVRCFGQKAIC